MGVTTNRGYTNRPHRNDGRRVACPRGSAPTIEANRNRIAQHSEDAHIKFGKLAGSRFAFFRGTALPFYRDMAGDIDYDVEPAIVEAIGSPALFVDDIVNLVDEAAGRVRRDHKMFKSDHALRRSIARIRGIDSAQRYCVTH